MNPIYVLPLDDPNATLEQAGGKGASLARLASAGLPVPGGFHITTQAYRKFVAENGLQPLILAALQTVDPSKPASLENASIAIHGLFSRARIPDEIATAVILAYQALPGDEPSVAVRSSATAEDLPELSFAGQQETFLNIYGTDAVLEAVKRSWASLWTARAIGYRVQHEIDQEAVSLAVVVQFLVEAEAAGILFTANPVNGRRDRAMITATWGLGEAIVGGMVTPDSLVVDKASGRVIERETADKQVMTVRTENGTREQATPEARRQAPVLSDRQAAELTRLGVQIEKLYELPVDIEWAFTSQSQPSSIGKGKVSSSEGKFYILQARPITALSEPPQEWPLPAPHVVYARGSLAEHIPSPVSPLFATLGLEIANQATARMWEKVIGKQAHALLAADGFYKAINGYVYGGMKMGPKEMITVLRVSLSQVAPMFRRSVPRWQIARQEFASVVDAWEQKQVRALSPAELLEGMRAVFSAASRYFTDIQTTLPAASMSETLFTQLYNRLIRRKNDPRATVFLVGFDTRPLEAEKSLYGIAAWLKANPFLAEYVLQKRTDALAAEWQRETPPVDISEALWAEWRARFQRHLDEFGRTAYEFDFANPTPAEAPGPLLDSIRAFLEGKASSPYERQREAAEKREQATQAVLRRTGWPRRGWFQRLLNWAQETGPVREDSIYDMGMGHPTIRRMLGELGRRFVEGGAIRIKDDIYWLEQQEVEDLASVLEAGQSLADYSERIPGRKAQWQAELRLTPPVMLPEKSRWSKLMHGGEAKSEDGRVVLKGVGTSGGKVTAPARVLFGPEDFGKMQPGDVLVAVTTTPAWTPLFTTASAVVTDIGGPLSHSSIVAREYGIPAVMAARVATRLIHSGDLITVDGNTGTVIIPENGR